LGIHGLEGEKGSVNLLGTDVSPIEQEGDNSKMTINQIYEDFIGWARGTFVKEETCIRGFDREPRRNESTWNNRAWTG